MLRLLALTIAFLATLWLLLENGVLHGGAAALAQWILWLASTLALPVLILLLLWAPGLFRDSFSRVAQFFARLGARRQEIDDLVHKIAHLDKAHHMALLGNVYRRQGRLRKAIDWFDKALQKEPDLVDARYKSGLCYFELGDYARAAEILEQICCEKPQHDYGLADLRLAQSLDRLGRTEEAEGAFKTLLQFYPGQPEGTYHYARLKASDGDRSIARELMNNVVFAVRHSPRFQRRKNRHWHLKAMWWLWHNK